ncbi:MAG: MbnP family protein [Candidatus Kapaibacteriota bacterium]
MNTLYFIACILVGFPVFSRDLSIIPMIGKNHITLNTPINSLDDTLRITACKLYISIPCSTKHIIHVLDIEETLTCSIPDEAETVIFGIDSMHTVNTDFTDALDPIHGMFWTWNSGYINVKIEGISRKSIQNGNIFQIHLGGYLSPYSTAFSIRIPRKAPIRMEVDLGPSIQAVLKQYGGTVMSPGKAGHELMTILQRSITIVE